MSEKKKERNPLVQCVKCRNLWYAIGILSVITILIVGFVFLDFYHHVNVLIVWDLIRYVGLSIVIAICGYVSAILFKEYCTEKHNYDTEYKRDSGKLIGACVATTIIILATVTIGYYLPATFAEYGIRDASTSEQRIELIKELPCSVFHSSYQTYGSYFHFYKIWLWTEENGLEEISYNLDMELNKPEWLYAKEKECK